MKPAAVPATSETFTAFSIQDGGTAQRFVRLHDGATARLEHHVSSQHETSGEWSGLLWGSVHIDAAAGEHWIDVVDTEPVICDRIHTTFSTCALRCFEKALRAQPKNGHRNLTLVGYYRRGGDHSFRKEDEQVFSAHFPNGERLALVVRVPGDDLPTGVWHLGLGGKLRHGRATVEFPVSLRELTGVEPPSAPPISEAPAAPEPAVASEKKSSAMWKIVAAGVVIAGGAAAFLLRPAAEVVPDAKPVVTAAQRESTVATDSIPGTPTAPAPAESAPSPAAVQPAATEPAPQEPPKPAPRQFRPDMTPVAAPKGPDQLIAPPAVQSPLTSSSQLPSPDVPSGTIPPAPRPAAPPPVETPKPVQQQPAATAPSGPTTPVKVVRRATPVLTGGAKATFRGEAIVDVRVEVDAAGRVINATAVTVRKGYEAAAAAAVEAARKSQFEPARNAGQPAAGQTTIQFRVQGETIRVSNPALR